LTKLVFHGIFLAWKLDEINKGRVGWMEGQFWELKTSSAGSKKGLNFGMFGPDMDQVGDLLPNPAFNLAEMTTNEER